MGAPCPRAFHPPYPETDDREDNNADLPIM
jgi:hypothetical protein